MTVVIHSFGVIELLDLPFNYGLIVLNFGFEYIFVILLFFSNPKHAKAERHAKFFNFTIINITDVLIISHFGECFCLLE